MESDDLKAGKIAEKWQADPVVRSCGGLHVPSADYEGDESLIGILQHVFETNIDLLTKARPELELNKIDLLVTSGLDHRALAYRCRLGQAIIVEIGLLRAFWTRIATVAHIPAVLSDAFPLERAPSVAWLSNDALVPGPDDWDMPQARIDYCFDILMFMIEYVILHELAHHMRGHLDLLSGASPVSFIDEAKARRRLPKPVVTASGFLMQDIEFDADAHGLDQSLVAMNEKFPFSARWSVEDASEWLFQMVFSQILAAQLFDRDGRALCDYASDGHPAPVHRSINYSNLAARTLHAVIGGDWETYRDSHDAAWYESSLVAGYLDYPAGRWHGERDPDLMIGNFPELERRYFGSSDRLDRLIDRENAPEGT